MICARGDIFRRSRYRSPARTILPDGGNRNTQLQSRTHEGHEARMRFYCLMLDWGDEEHDVGLCPWCRGPLEKRSDHRRASGRNRLVLVCSADGCGWIEDYEPVLDG